MFFFLYIFYIFWIFNATSFEIIYCHNLLPTILKISIILITVFQIYLTRCKHYDNNILYISKKWTLSCHFFFFFQENRGCGGGFSIKKKCIRNVQKRRKPLPRRRWQSFVCRPRWRQWRRRVIVIWKMKYFWWNEILNKTRLFIYFLPSSPAAVWWWISICTYISFDPFTRVVFFINIIIIIVVVIDTNNVCGAPIKKIRASFGESHRERA